MPPVEAIVDEAVVWRTVKWPCVKKHTILVLVTNDQPDLAGAGSDWPTTEAVTQWPVLKPVNEEGQLKPDSISSEGVIIEAAIVNSYVVWY